MRADLPLRSGRVALVSQALRTLLMSCSVRARPIWCMIPHPPHGNAIRSHRIHYNTLGRTATYHPDLQARSDVVLEAQSRSRAARLSLGVQRVNAAAGTQDGTASGLVAINSVHCGYPAWL
jgi:hypothetical protein